MATVKFGPALPGLVKQILPPYYDGSSPTSYRTPASWQLDTGHHEETKAWTSTAFASQTAADVADTIIYPRPDSETGTFARHRWAHTQMDYEIPLGVRAGDFTYRVDVDEANTSAAIASAIVLQSTFSLTEPYKLTIPQATIAGLSTGVAYNISLKWTDQSGKFLRQWWSFNLEVNELDHFFFVDDTNAGTQDGKFATPFNNIQQAGWMAPGDGASSAQKILVIKEGNSQVTPLVKNASWTITPTQFPSACINIPGERPKIDLQATEALCSLTTNSNDVFYRGLEVINGKPGGSTGYGGFTNGFQNEWHRTTITDCIFDTVASWTAAATNVGGIHFENNVNRQYLFLSDLTFANLAGSSNGNNGSPITLMGWKYYLIERITASYVGTSGLTAASIVYHKHSLTDGTTRLITATDNIYLGRGCLYCDDTTTTGAYYLQNIEFLYNNLKPTAGSGISIFGTGGNDYDPTGPWWVIKNTIRDGGIGVGATTAGTSVYIHNNASTSTLVDNSGITLDEVKNFDSLVTATHFDADGTLNATGLSFVGEVAGVIGHEVA